VAQEVRWLTSQISPSVGEGPLPLAREGVAGKGPPSQKNEGHPALQGAPHFARSPSQLPHESGARARLSHVQQLPKCKNPVRGRDWWCWAAAREKFLPGSGRAPVVVEEENCWKRKTRERMQTLLMPFFWCQPMPMWRMKNSAAFSTPENQQRNHTGS